MAASTHQLAGLALPVLVSIPHAGRDLPAWVAADARVPEAQLRRLSDPWCDLIAAPLLAAGARVVKANMVRAVVDCNRHEGDMDPVDVAAVLRPQFAPPGRKARAGLGVVPTRLPGCGRLWRSPITSDDFLRRIEGFHRPYHQQMADACDALMAAHGRLLLIDLHSMPSLPRPAGVAGAPVIVIGNRHGRSADQQLTANFVQSAVQQGFATALNHPYPGGFIAERYGRPHLGVHAVQIEFDRTLYLDAEGQPDADHAFRLGEWLRDTALHSLTMLGARDDWPLAAE